MWKSLGPFEKIIRIGLFLEFPLRIQIFTPFLSPKFCKTCQTFISDFFLKDAEICLVYLFWFLVFWMLNIGSSLGQVKEQATCIIPNIHITSIEMKKNEMEMLYYILGYLFNTYLLLSKSIGLC